MADDAELIKAAAQGITEGTLAPLHQIVLNIFGPSSETLGRVINERVKRFEKRSKEMLLIADTKPDELSVKLLLPIIQNGAIEENDELQDRWAALLVNTAVEDIELPAAPEILKQLTPLDVCFLQMCYEETLRQVDKCNHEAQPFHIFSVEVTNTFEEWKSVIEARYGIHASASGKYEPAEWALTSENVIRLGLVKAKPTGQLYLGYDPSILMMTELGYRFIGLCQIPDSSC